MMRSIIEKPRALPRVAIATLALGGPTLLGACGGGATSHQIMDAGVADGATLDGGTQDAGLVDAGTRDAGAVDAGTRDAGAVDAGTQDAGAMDAGTQDAGAMDAGTQDAGAMDAGVADGGAVDPVRAYCTALASCENQPAAYVDTCVQSQDLYLSYYDVACMGAIRNALACLASNASCADLISGNKSACQSEVQQELSTCSGTSGAIADFCGLYTACNGGNISDISTCLNYAQYYRSYSANYYGYYNLACAQAWDTLYECYANTNTCSNLFSGCYSEANAFYSACY